MTRNYRPTGQSVHTQLAALITHVEIIEPDPSRIGDPHRPAYVQARARLSDRHPAVTIMLTLDEALSADIIEPVQ